MNEHGYIKSIHRHVPKETFVWKINDNFAGGVPDAFYCDDGGALFVEYKYIPKVPVRPTTQVIPKLSPIQVLWLKERYEQNFPVAVILGTPKGGVIFTNCAWETGILSRDLEQYALSPKDLGRIIYDHCKGILTVTDNEQTYSYCC